MNRRLPPWCDWSGEAIDAAIRDVVEQLGYVPSWSEYKDLAVGNDDLPSHDTLYRANGGWPESLRAAGFNPRAVHGDVDEALELARRLEI